MPSPLTITAANVTLVSGAQSTGVAATALTPGMPVYQDSSNSNRWTKCDADATGKDACTGVTLTTADAAGQPIVVATTAGTVIGFGAILTVAEGYFVGSTAGLINPTADITTNWKPCLIGWGITTSNMQLVLSASGVAHA